MLDRLYRTMRARPGLRWAGVFAILGATWTFHVVTSLRWLDANPLPNGFQNEILHLGNALDIAVVLQFRNWRLFHDFLFKGYWPPLFYLVSLIPVSILGPSRDAFVASNFLHLAILLGATYGIGRRLFSPVVGIVAAVGLSFFPSIYGNLVRFEPNVAMAATVTLGLWALLRSRDFVQGRWAVAFGLISGGGLLMDRLAYPFFLWAPALGAFFRGLRSGAASRVRRVAVLRNGVWSVVALLVVCGYYLSFFFALHSEEIFSQAVAGEIIETGERTEIRDLRAPLTWLFYPLTLFDSQVGPALTLALLPALIYGLKVTWEGRRSRLLLLWLFGSLALFSLVQKKQLFYTIPLLPAVALVAAAGWGRLGGPWLRGLWLGGLALLAVNQHQATLSGQGWLSRGRALRGGLALMEGRSPLPDAWVAPRYPQARPPDGVDMRLDEIMVAVDEIRDGLPVFRIGTYSEDPVLFEGYLTFAIRAANPYLRVNGLIGNVQAFYEWARNMDLFVYATSDPTRVWPAALDIDRTLESFHRQNEAYPAGDLLEGLQDRFELRRSFALDTGTRIYLYAPRPTVEDPEPDAIPGQEGLPSAIEGAPTPSSPGGGED